MASGQSDDTDELGPLYAAPLSGFLDARKALAATLKKAGDKQRAAEVAALPKPTPAAWAVNQVARRNATDMAALLELGAEIRAAMRLGLAGDPSARARLTALEAEQQELIGMLLTLAKAQLEGDGAPSSQVVLDRIKTTLTTISTIGTWGDGEPGRLQKELGVPSVETLAALLLDDGKAPSTGKAAPTAVAAKPRLAVVDGKQAAEEAEKRRVRDAALQAARDTLRSAKATADAASAAAAAARSEREAAKAALEARSEDEARARQQVEALEANLADAREAARAAASALRTAKSSSSTREESLVSALRDEASAARGLVEAERNLAAITSKYPMD